MGGFRYAQWGAAALWLVATAVLAMEIIVDDYPTYTRSVLLYTLALAVSVTLVTAVASHSARVRAAFRLGEALGWRVGYQTARDEGIEAPGHKKGA